LTEGAAQPRHGALVVALVWAGPGSFVASAFVLCVAGGLGYFAHGPGVPTAGLALGHSALWLALALVALGHLAAMPAALLALTRSLRTGPAVGRMLAIGLLYDLLIGLPILVWLLAG
jgi:hypothetical protein